MSDDQEVLPTAAYRWRDKAGVDQASINDPESPWCNSYSEMHGKDELVRRQDVEALIQDKIENVEVNPVDEEIAIEQSKILQKLLDEVQQQ